MFPTYRRILTQRLVVASPLIINLTCVYDTAANTGTITAIVKNDSNFIVNGNIYFAVIENSIAYSWYGLPTVEHVCRDMLPTGTGTAVSVPLNDSITQSQPFTISAAWNENNVYIAVWVQNTSTKETYQAGFTKVVPQPDMEYMGLTYSDAAGNNNRVAEPGETITMYITAKNNAGGSYTGSTSMTTSDPYITINSQTPQTTAIQAGEVDTVLIADCTIDPGCPVDYLAQFALNFQTASDTSTARLIITNDPGFEDDIEAGQGSWTHGGNGDLWHISTYRSYSPTHSWYNGNDGSHTYPNFQVAYLISPYFVVTPDSALTFWQYLYTQPSADYCYFEIDNNCGWWRIMGIYDGSQTTWTQKTFPLNEYSGQTIRLRYRCISNSTTAYEGWYIDDIRVPMVFGIEENQNAHAKPYSLMLAPNPFSKLINISFTSGQITKNTEMKIYDATGRLVKQFNNLTIQPTNQITWYGDDDAGNHLPAGTYFVEISGENGIYTEKALLLR